MPWHQLLLLLLLALGLAVQMILLAQQLHQPSTLGLVADSSGNTLSRRAIAALARNWYRQTFPLALEIGKCWPDPLGCQASLPSVHALHPTAHWQTPPGLETCAWASFAGKSLLLPCLAKMCLTDCQP
jgi:hypothetical protein